jgi:hypothetical protein
MSSDGDDEERKANGSVVAGTLVSVLVEITSAGGYGARRGTATNNGDGDTEPFPSLDDDEAYTLVLPYNNGSSAGGSKEEDESLSGLLRASTVWGALRGLETLAQLVDQVTPTLEQMQQQQQQNKKQQEEEEGSEEGSDDGPVVPPLLVVRRLPIAIADAPRYPWRGLLLDSANHFLPLTALRTFVDAMSSVKVWQSRFIYLWALSMSLDEQGQTKFHLYFFTFFFFRFPSLSHEFSLVTKKKTHTPTITAMVTTIKNIQNKTTTMSSTTHMWHTPMLSLSFPRSI